MCFIHDPKLPIYIFLLLICRKLELVVSSKLTKTATDCEYSTLCLVFPQISSKAEISRLLGKTNTLQFAFEIKKRWINDE